MFRSERTTVQRAHTSAHLLCMFFSLPDELVEFIVDILESDCGSGQGSPPAGNAVEHRHCRHNYPYDRYKHRTAFRNPQSFRLS